MLLKYFALAFIVFNLVNCQYVRVSDRQSYRPNETRPQRPYNSEDSRNPKHSEDSSTTISSDSSSTTSNDASNTRLSNFETSATTSDPLLNDSPLSNQFEKKFDSIPKRESNVDHFSATTKAFSFKTNFWNDIFEPLDTEQNATQSTNRPDNTSQMREFGNEESTDKPDNTTQVREFGNEESSTQSPFFWDLFEPEKENLSNADSFTYRPQNTNSDNQTSDSTQWEPTRKSTRPTPGVRYDEEDTTKAAIKQTAGVKYDDETNSDQQPFRTNETRPQSPNTSEDSRSPQPYRPQETRPCLCPCPCSPEYSRAPQSYKPEGIRPQKTYSPDDSRAQQYRPEESRPQQPYSPEDSQAQQPYRPEESRPQQPYSPEDSRAQQPYRPEETRPQQPYSPEDSQAQQPYRPEESRPQQPYSPEDSRVPQSFRPEETRPQQPYSPKDSRAQHPYRPAETRTQRPYTPEDSRSPQPYRPQGFRPQRPYSPEDSRAQQPYGPEESRPQKPYSADDYRAPQPYQPEDTGYARPDQQENYRTPRPDGTHPQKSFRPQTKAQDSNFVTYAPYFPTRAQVQQQTSTYPRHPQHNQSEPTDQYEDTPSSTPLAPHRRQQTPAYDEPRDAKPDPEPGNRFRPVDYNNIRRYGVIPPTPERPSTKTRDRDQRRQQKPKTISQIIENPNLVVDGRPQYFTILRDNLNRGGLLNALNRPSSLTMFVPTDEAFNSLPEGVLEEMQRNPTALRKMLMQHILSFNLSPRNIKNNVIVQSITGEPHILNVIPGGKILVDGVPVIASTSVQNGIVYVISKVLPSPDGKSRNVIDELRKRPELSTFLEIAEQTNYASKLKGPGPYTLFVPSNQAFDDSLETLDEISNNPLAYKDFMRNHITSGAHYSNELRNTQSVPLSGRNFLTINLTPNGECIINNSTKILTPDITTGNGVIHVLDSIIIPQTSLLRQQKAETKNQRLEKPKASQQSVAHLAQRLGTKRFVNWLTKSGIIDDIIKDGREYTIIAPNDKAVGKLPLKIQSLLNTEPKRVKILLEYHVLPGFINFSNLTDDEILPTISGKDVRFNKPPNNTVMTLSGAPIAKEATHGNVMLVSVDSVLYPPQGNIYTIITKSPILKSMVDIIKAANMEEELSQPGPYTIFVPKDEALQQNDPQLIDRLKRDSNSSRDFIRKHIILSTVFTSALPVSSDGSKSSSAQSITGDTLKLIRKPNCVSVNGVTLSYSDITATNGVVHVVDHVL